MKKYSPLRELYFSRLREFLREPARVFWVYGFPTVLAIILGMAFRGQARQTLVVDVVGEGEAAKAASVLRTPPSASVVGEPEFQVHESSAELADRRLKTGKTALVIRAEPGGELLFRFDPSRPDAIAARNAADARLQRSAGRQDAIPVKDDTVTELGGRYIDFLIPGLLGMNALGGSMWGIGFLLVNFRRNGLLKRFRATPMRRRDFLLAILLSRLTWLTLDVVLLLSVGAFIFQMPIRGSIALVVLLVFFGASAFSGIGLLVASRARNTETVNGLMNLVMMPMWLCSGIFFSYERFPEILHPLIRALPLTQLLDGLRMVILEGAGLVDVWPAMAILAAWGIPTFLLAIRWFRWT